MKKAGDIISALFMERFGPEFVEKARANAGLFSSWTKIVTEVWPRSFYSEQEKDDVPAAASHSRIRELERGVLLVEADHPGWIQILQTKQGDLLSAVRRHYPELDIRGMAFRLSREPFREPVIDGDANNPADEAVLDNDPEPEPVQTVDQEDNPSKNEEFYSALKSLEKSIKKRNTRKNTR